MKSAVLVVLVIVFAACGTAEAAKLGFTPQEVEIECDGDAETVEVHYKGPAACGFDLVVDWSDSFLDDMTADDFELGGGWSPLSDMYWDAWDCSSCGYPVPPGKHIHIQIIDWEYIGLTSGCIFSFDVHDESPCSTGEVNITVVGVAYDCEDPPNYIEPLLLPDGCTVTITSE